MPNLTKAEKKAAAAEKKDQRQAAEKKAKKLQMTEILGGAGIGAAEALLEKNGVTFLSEGFGPVKGSWLKLGVGGYLAFKSKKPKVREVGSAAAVIGAYQTSKELVADFSLDGIFGGG